MSARDFKELVSARWDEKKFLCVGLDSDFKYIPGHLKALGPREGILAFNVGIIEATKDVASAYKPNTAFYEAYGEDGLAALLATCDEIRSLAPDVPIILDAKRGDIDSTNEGYAAAAFDVFKADAITVQPYMGGEALQPFLRRDEKGIIVLCRTSNKSAGEFQDAVTDGEPLYMHVARKVSREWNTNGNCGLVVGATFPKEMQAVREAAIDLPILIPGIGAQGGDIEKSVKAGLDSNGRGIWMSASRSIIYASSGADFAEKAAESARTLHSAITKSL